MFELTFVQMITNLSADAAIGGPIWQLVNAFCWIMALILACVAAMQLKEVAEQQRQMSYRAPIFTFIASAMLASAPTALVSTAIAIYGGDANTSPLAYVTAGSTPTPTRALLTIVQVIGYIFFVRGILEMRRAGEPNRFQNASVGKALTIMISGMAAVYINFTLSVIAETTGWNVEAFIGP